MTQEATAPSLELKLEVRKGPEETIVVCAGRITSNTSPLLQNTVRPLLSESKRIVLDLSEVSYMDSSGLGSLVGLWVTSRKANCEFKLVKLTDRIKDLLKMSNLSKVLESDHEYLGM
jgi:anti-sigma B factor antagonist